MIHSRLFIQRTVFVNFVWLCQQKKILKEKNVLKMYKLDWKLQIWYQIATHGRQTSSLTYMLHFSEGHWRNYALHEDLIAIEEIIDEKEKRNEN